MGPREVLLQRREKERAKREGGERLAADFSVRQVIWKPLQRCVVSLPDLQLLVASFVEAIRFALQHSALFGHPVNLHGVHFGIRRFMAHVGSQSVAFLALVHLGSGAVGNNGRAGA
eukprot:scaffold2119_cov264-Pinguiococcus_pyrenoidosus.AAC.10